MTNFPLSKIGRSIHKVLILLDLWFELGPDGEIMTLVDIFLDVDLADLVQIYE